MGSKVGSCSGRSKISFGFMEMERLVAASDSTEYVEVERHGKSQIQGPVQDKSCQRLSTRRTKPESERVVAAAQRDDDAVERQITSQENGIS